MAHSYTMDLAKRDFLLGHLEGFEITRAVMANGWQIGLADGRNVGFLATARDSQRARTFKTLDAAVLALEEIGFKVEFLTK